MVNKKWILIILKVNLLILFVVLLSSIAIYSKQVSAETSVTYWDSKQIKLVTTTEKEFLQMYGFYKKKVFYKGYNNKNELAVKLYFNSKTKKGCGVSYAHGYAFGFEIDSDTYSTQKGFTHKKYSLIPDNLKDQGDYKNEYDLYSSNGVTNYKEKKTYKVINKKKRLINFTSTGTYEGEKIELKVIDFSYNKKGKLISKHVGTSTWIYATTESTVTYYYDELERLYYSDSYLSHGSLEQFYIYSGNNKTPSYILRADHNLDVVDCYLIKITK